MCRLQRWTIARCTMARMLLSALLATIAATAADAQNIELRARPSPSRLVFKVPVDQVRAAVQAGLRQLSDLDERRRYRLVTAFGTALFPSDPDIEMDAKRRGTMEEVASFLGLPTPDRHRDLLITPDIDYFWPADYYAGNQRIGFATAFILHFSQSGPDTTTIDILQINGFVRLGKRFDLLGRTGPKFYWDDRPAAPSPQASRDLAAVLARISAH